MEKGDVTSRSGSGPKVGVVGCGGVREKGGELGKGEGERGREEGAEVGVRKGSGEGKL